MPTLQAPVAAVEHPAAARLLLSQRDAAVVLGVSVKLVRRWTTAGRLPIWTDPESGRVYYPRPALERWAANAGITSVTAPAEACDGSTNQHHTGAAS